MTFQNEGTIPVTDISVTDSLAVGIIIRSK
ncbi:hypothetical protein ACT7DA_04615 [Bacillus pacificus]